MKTITGFENGKEHLSRKTQRTLDDTESLDKVLNILKRVKMYGDQALRAITLEIDKVELSTFEVPTETIAQAYKSLEPSLRNSLESMAKRIKDFHAKCLPQSWFLEMEGYGERFAPLERAGIYIPGGRGAYPSTVLMTVIPAKVAGVENIILATPPQSNGIPNQVTLAASYIAEVDKVFSIGGAQAIAAMAYGTESITKCDIVCGPGNIYVTQAKKMIFGEVAVDGLYGPTESIVIGDQNTNPIYCAADLIAQAEHDPLASPILITNSEELISNVLAEIDNQLEELPTKSVASEALKNQGAAILTETIEQAVELANIYAPEHLCLLVDNPLEILKSIKNAGGVFLGEYSPEVIGDYLAGPSHVMPTGGTAKFSSPLGVHQFLKVTSVVGLNHSTFNKLVEDGIKIALAEGFFAHAKAMEARTNKA
jgi:histidinol dehydrogenase